jgi:aminoglycoside phosphotransferase (APT) family kinase protein
LVRQVTGVSADTDRFTATPLSGGVSSDIYRVDADGLTFCVKRALPKLKVAADWRAPVERNRYEVGWMRTAAGIVPDSVPGILGEDPAAGAFAMAWLPPDRFPVWKALLRDGVIEPRDGTAVGTVLGRIHAATADRPGIAAAFATDALFEAIRIEPYLLATATRHPDLAGQLADIAATTRSTRRTLVHGDFSPKNLLIGPTDPVVLDAECAWFGDPAFDLAFVLNHLLLKGAWHPAWRGRYVEVYAALVAAYRDHVDWEPWPDVERRTAALLPALLLARVDGKSPVEYLVGTSMEDSVRRFARRRVADRPQALEAIADEWKAHETD